MKKYLNKALKRNCHGYRLIRVGELWLPEHKLIVESYIGRMLENGEVIHHINGNKEDNKIGNLMLFPNQREHNKFHRILREFGVTPAIKKQINERWKYLKK